MKKLGLFAKYARWRDLQRNLAREIDLLRRENVRLRQKLAVLQKAKDQAERFAEERRREKEALRAKVVLQKKELDGQRAEIEDLGAKIAALRERLEQ